MDKELQRLLKGVSRSIYLSIRILPKKLRDPVGIAYLFCRTADTIADTDLVPVQQRLQVLREFRSSFSPSLQRRGEGEVCPSLVGPTSAEAILLQSTSKIFSDFNHFSPAVQQIISDLVAELTQGMEMDLTNHSIPNRSALDQYTYYVAGVVGKFWTRILIETIPACRRLDSQQMIEWGINYGKGLQLINVLRDLPRDLQMGRCYLPADELAAADMILVYARWLELAKELLEDGRRYIAALPRRLFRVRMATALPLRLGFATLDLLKNNPQVLNPRVVIKIPRWKVYAALITAR